MPSDSVGDLVDAAAPLVRFEASERTRTRTIRAARRRAGAGAPRAARFAIASSIAVMLIGGGTATAFAASPQLRQWMAPHIDDPYVTIEYTVPSGSVCMVTWGDVVADDRDAAAALRDWLASADLLSLIDVDAALIRLRSDDERPSLGVGSDDEYQWALSDALVLAARAELEQRGFPAGSIDSWSAESDCMASTP